MKNRKHFNLILATLVVLLSLNSTYGQLCDEAGKAQALNTQMQWVLSHSEVKNPKWITALNPILTEMQRVFPQPPKGLYMRNTITTLMNYEAASPKDIHRYKGYFAIRNIFCQRAGGMNKFYPAEDPEAFVYFDINEMFSGGLSDEFQNLKVGDLRLAENPNGIKGIYEFNENDEQKFIGWYFSENKGLPFRRLSKGELAQKFREYWVNKLDARIKELETALGKTPKSNAEISASPYLSAKNKEEIIKTNLNADVQRKKDIEFAKSQREDCLRRADLMMKATDSKSDARVTFLNPNIYEPEKLEAPTGKGKYVYVENRDFFDQKLPKWQPQFILAWMDRYDNSAAQLAFSQKFENEFDFNVIRKLVGMQPLAKVPTISNLGSTEGGYTSGKVDNANAENSASESTNGVLFSENFANSALGQAPTKWTVSNDPAIVRNDTGQSGNWLTVKKAGLFFPDYSTLLLPTNFTLEFDLSWNKNISYYSPNFVLHLGAARYDNTLKRYDRQQVNLNSYTSARMERVELWIDPHWNNNGYFGLEVYDAAGGFLKNKRDKTPIFFKDKNKVRVKIVRNGSMLSLYFNDTRVMEEAVLGENIRWNFFGFGLTNAPNAEADDEFYLSNIRLLK